MAEPLRRAEFKRARKRRWRKSQRHPIGRVMRECFRTLTDVLREALHLTTPELWWFRNYPTGNRDHGPTTTLATSQEAVSVNYGGTESHLPITSWGSYG